jgi:hypothetical protein
VVSPCISSLRMKSLPQPWYLVNLKSYFINEHKEDSGYNPWPVVNNR